MKNWKDKALGILAGIGLMSLLMGSYSPQSQTGKYTMTTYRNDIARMDTQTGIVYLWKYNYGWDKLTD